MLKLRDVDTGDRCDGYTDRTEDLPSGVGVGAVLVIENAKRGVSNTMQCYVKFTPGTRVTVETPSHATLGSSRASVPAPLQSRTVRLADIAAAAAAGAGAVDNRLWEFRARVDPSTRSPSGGGASSAGPTPDPWAPRPPPRPKPR